MTPDTSAVTATLEVARCVALRLDERLAREHPVQISGNGQGSRTDSDLLASWRDALCPTEPSLLDRRLEWDGLEKSRVAELMAAPKEPPLPIAPWAEFLADACNACAASLRDPDRSQNPTDPVPFEEVLLPFVHVARCRLRQLVVDLDRVILPSAQASAERALLKELSAIAEQALFAEFATLRATHGGPGLGFDRPPRSLYRRFVRSFRHARLRPLIERYPVLGRLLAVRATFWVEASAELVVRLRADRDGLAETFDIDPLAAVTRLRQGLGDSHGRGRTVTSVRFTSGTEIIYKPRSLGIDVAFYGLLEWLNGRGLNPCQRTLKVLNRGMHGWVEKVQPRSMSTDEEVASYFERAGALLAIAYMLGAMDLHHGNVIAVGPDPVPVDLETIMATSAPRLGQDHDKGVVLRQSQSNVLRTGLLPYWRTTRDGWKLHPGGMGGISKKISGVTKTWCHTNTDWMVRRDEVRVTGQANCARRATEIRTPVDHVEDVVCGFERAYSALQRHRNELVSDRGPLAAFRGCRVRVLLRNTRAYHSAMRRSLHPKHLGDGLDHSLQFELLKARLLRRDTPVGFWYALGAEHRDLEDLDYPLFCTASDGLDLYDSQGCEVGTFGSASPHSDTIERVAGLNDDDRQRQTALIRFTFACLSAPLAPEPCDPGNDKPAATAPAASEARAIGRVLESLFIKEPDGAAYWVGRQWAERERGPRPVECTLYDGSVGVALFLVALDTVAGSGHRDLAGEALLPLRSTLRNSGTLAALADRTGIGIAKGIGGIVYALAQIGRMTDDASWLDDARLVASAIDSCRIRADKAIDVLNGTSGVLLSLLSLYELVGERWILERAIECGEHILATETTLSAKDELRCASGRFSRQAGFAHGVGGISSALARLARADGNEQFAAASETGFRLAVSDAGSSLEGTLQREDGRVPPAAESSLWRHTWCNGGVGTELGHIYYGLGPLPRSSTVLDTANADLGTTDHPCCGNLGRAELLLSADRMDLAADLVDRVVERAGRAGSYRMGNGVPDARWAPGFFQGLSGVGYQLLRIVAPSRLPCVLAFE
ncbi:MAG: type 2 lantipeptide synthetase LanM [Gemmatimonadetes bacterium]|nr:type 2 lantipeptide synthetase LanM [Gemmatimonadota bacterium]MYE94794.1 type 2 lantipeptide synthetase LanM [Gemmatimonadota bacterium]MYJ10833.1 type 2 lantipeptide synthetase LanM [Gemmatimonadota bacterium]